MLTVSFHLASLISSSLIHNTSVSGFVRVSALSSSVCSTFLTCKWNSLTCLENGGVLHDQESVLSPMKNGS